MAGRGRGGGRGGRGRGMTFDARDMGFAPGEQLPGPVLQPPPLFPPLDYHPATMETEAEMVYMVALKKDLTDYLKDHLALSETGEIMKELDSALDWALLPDELKSTKRKKAAERLAAKKANFDINSLSALEKLEETADEPEEEKEGEDETKKDEENENEDEDTEDDVDDEMDDGTDYVNNYFDNGEGLDDDDDTGNDGPVY